MQQRVFFRRPQAAFRAVRGEPILRLQRTLDNAGLLRLGVDGQFGDDTEQALKRFQAASGLDATGLVDLSTWNLAVSAEAPGLFDRCLQLTADFEGHGFGLVQGNFDGAGLTWGIIGFTLQSGGIQSVVQAADAVSRDLVDGSFGELADELRMRMHSPIAACVRWGDSISQGVRKVGVVQPWKVAFRLFGQIPEVQRIQIEGAGKYWRRASEIVRAYGLESELGHALAFDIAVQNGGIEEAEARRIEREAALAPSGERHLLEIIANAVAEGSKPRWIENVRRRKLAIATGEGTVNRANYRLPDWGLDAVDAGS